jgi:ferredoxin
MPDRAGSPPARLRVDPVACDGIGMCAHLAAELVRLDSWGYAIVPDRDLEPRELRRAAQAVAACPRKALSR